jgi:hypothetical protein
MQKGRRRGRRLVYRRLPSVMQCRVDLVSIVQELGANRPKEEELINGEADLQRVSTELYQAELDSRIMNRVRRRHALKLSPAEGHRAQVHQADADSALARVDRDVRQSLGHLGAGADQGIQQCVGALSQHRAVALEVARPSCR